MKKKITSLIKDSAVGVGIGCAVIIPGISAGTIAIVTKTFKKIVDAVDNLFTNNFLRSLLTLLPFGIFGVATVALLIKPLGIAMSACLFAILALFAGFISGSLPGVVDEVRDDKVKAKNIVLLIVGFLAASIIGVLSVLFDFSSSIDALFASNEWYIYPILFGVGILGSTGLIVPGFSGSALLLIMGFYKPILNVGEKVISFGPDFWPQFLLLLTFAVGVLVGFILFSKLMNKLITKHKQSTYFTIIGFIVGSLVSIFLNSNTVAYFQNNGFTFLDTLLTPILFGVGFVVAYIIVNLARKNQKTLAK